MYVGWRKQTFFFILIGLRQCAGLSGINLGLAVCKDTYCFAIFKIYALKQLGTATCGLSPRSVVSNKANRITHGTQTTQQNDHPSAQKNTIKWHQHTERERKKLL